MQQKYKSSSIIKGEVIQLGDVRVFGSGTESREIVIKTGTESYPKGLPIEFIKDGVRDLDPINPGDIVEIEYFVEGSAIRDTNKFYVHLRGVQIAAAGGNVRMSAPAPSAQGGAATMQTAVDAWRKGHGDDMKGFADFCTAQRPDIVALAQKGGVKFSQFVNTHRPEVWADIVARINALETAAAEMPDDLPF